jgi:DNA-binding HxlR family transcriptional regulator
VLGRDYGTQDCSIARSLEVVGERWTLLVLRDLTFGLRRYDELRRSLGIAPNVLADRLGRLTDEGLVVRRLYQHSPERFEYVLSDKGRGLAPVLFHLAKWGDLHYPSPLGPPRVSLHAGCGGSVDERLHCATCDASVWFDEIETAPRGTAQTDGVEAGAPAAPAVG